MERGADRPFINIIFKIMRTTNKAFATRFVAVIIFASLSSFALMPGGDTFSIYLNNKLVAQEHVQSRKIAAPLLLDDGAEGELRILYSHCGETGSSRKLSLRNSNNKVLKEWSYPDVDKTQKDPMAFQIKEIKQFKKGNAGLALFYTAKELPKELMLAPIEWSEKTARKD